MKIWLQPIPLSTGLLCLVGAPDNVSLKLHKNKNTRTTPTLNRTHCLLGIRRDVNNSATRIPFDYEFLFLRNQRIVHVSIMYLFYLSACDQLPEQAWTGSGDVRYVKWKSQVSTRSAGARKLYSRISIFVSFWVSDWDLITAAQLKT